jgi:alpha-1,2-mannosyltransferase
MVTGDAFRAGLVNLVHAGLREGAWATAVRLRCYALLAIAIYVAVAIGALAMSRNGIGHDGQPIGTDFASFWNAARLALAGEPLIPYDIQAFAKAQQEAMGPIPFYAFFYPPSFLLLLAPLGALPYLAALAAFLGLSFALVVYAASRIVPTRVALLTLAAAPAFFIALGHGQNAFLLAGLLGLGLVLLDRRPIAAGLLIAAASIKPQLGLLIPVALLCGGYWRALIAAGLGTLGLAGLTGVAFGPEIWQAFLDQMPAASATMRDGLVPWGKMVTVYAALRVLDAGEVAGLVLQAAVSLAALVMVALVWRDRAPACAPLRYAILIAAIPLAAPVALDYDMFLLLLPVLWLMAQGSTHGFRPWEISIAAAVYLLPFIARPLALNLGVPVAPLVLVGFVVMLLRRWHAFGGRFSGRLAKL